MTWRVEIKTAVETGTEIKYRIWSTITDSFITEWSTKPEIINYLFWNRVRTFINDFNKDAMTFPNGYYRVDNTRIFDKETMLNFYDYQDKAIRTDNVLEAKFIEELNKIGVKICIEDKDYTVKNF